jgi:hypothetical protein
MSTEPEIILTFLYKRSGKTELKDSELYLPLSLELGWFTNQEARDFVTYAKEQNLLQEKNDKLIPTIKINSTPIPIGFYPSKKHYGKKTQETSPKETSLLQQLTQELTTITHQTQSQIETEIQDLAHNRCILPEIAALYLAATHQLPIEQYYQQVEHQLFHKK